jgi:hypothetical protein
MPRHTSSYLMGRQAGRRARVVGRQPHGGWLRPRVARLVLSPHEPEASAASADAALVAREGDLCIP